MARTKTESKEQYQKHKEAYIERASKNYYKNRIKKIAQSKKWADSNKEKVRAYKQKWKQNNKFNKNVEQQTRRKYGLIKGHCMLCNRLGDVRHHNTTPYHIDKWIILCTECHRKIHRWRQR